MLSIVGLKHKNSTKFLIYQIKTCIYLVISLTFRQPLLPSSKRLSYVMCRCSSVDNGIKRRIEITS